MAIIQFEEGLFSLRLGHGAALTCPRHVIHSRAAVKDYYDKNGIAYDPDKFQIHDCEHCHD